LNPRLPPNCQAFLGSLQVWSEDFALQQVFAMQHWKFQLRYAMGLLPFPKALLAVFRVGNGL
jgi:hypothetical protein